MKNLISLTVLLAVFGTACITSAEIKPSAGESFPVITDDGAWCWFSEPRAIGHKGKTITGWVKKDGSIEMAAFGKQGSPIQTFTLHSKLQYDDHNNPAFLPLPDGRIAGFYNTHGNDDLFLRITKRPSDYTAWTAFQRLGMRDKSKGNWGMTYVNPVRLPEEKNTIFLFFRGSDYKPNLTISKDLCKTWSKPKTLVARDAKGDTNRPYARYWDDGKGRINIIFTDGHPRNEKTNRVFFMTYHNGAFHKADGTQIGTVEELPIHPEKADVVYDGTKGRGWIWDVGADAQGNPVIAYTRLPGDSKETIGKDHRYHYARWDGKAWIDNEIAKAGKWFPHTAPGATEREPHYSPGISLDKRDPSVVWYAAAVNDRQEIFRATTQDGGATWKREQLTVNSANDNIRPITIRNPAPGAPEVLWMNLRSYPHFTKYDCSVRAFWE